MNIHHVIVLVCGVAALLCPVLPVQASPLREGSAPQEVYSSPGGMGWVIKPGMLWKENPLQYSAESRKYWLKDLYEEIDLKKERKEKPLHTGDPFGLKILRYYVIGSKDEEEWSIVDTSGKEYMRFSILYSADRVYSRQTAMENFIEMVRRMPWVKREEFSYRKKEDGTVMLVRNNKDRAEMAFMERGGYCVWVNGYGTWALSYEEERQAMESILDVLSGKRKFGFFPKRALWLQKLRRMSSRERSDWERSVKQQAQSGMPPGGWRNRRSKGDKLAQKLNMEEMIRRIGAREKKEKEWLYPNINSGVGTIAWIRKNMDIPFIPDKGNDETHTNGVTGRFMLQGKDGKIPVRYMIAHLRKQSEALLLLTTLLANQYNDRFDVDKMAEVIRVRPGLVGDYDLCLKPVINELGVPAHGMEHAWIGFVRGGTVVLLKSEDMNASVLELARIIDTALKRNIEAYETPEEIR